MRMKYSHIFALFWKSSSCTPSSRRILDGISDKRATYIGKQAEVLLEITYSPSQITGPPEASSTPGCLRLAVLRENISRCEHYPSNIIKKIVKLADAMPLDLPFVIYDRESPFYRLNAVTFIKKLKPTGYIWIATAFCLAIEHKVYNLPPMYANESAVTRMA